MNETQQYRVNAINTAMHLMSRGIKVFPAAYGSKSPLIPIEHGSWKDYATTDPTAFVNLLNKHTPNKAFNLAAIFGPESGVCDVEPDDDQAAETLEGFIKESGVRTIAYKSRRGTHYFFRWEPRLAVFKSSNLKVKNLECRLGVFQKDGTVGGQYSITPPSLHPDTGEYYQWLPGCEPWSVAPAPMPENLIQYFETNYRSTTSRLVEVDSNNDGYLPGEGHRHEWLLAFARHLFCDWLLPLEECMELTRIMSQRTGSYYMEGRGETELVNLFKRLTRPVDPIKEMTAAVDMANLTDVIDIVRQQQRAEKAGMCPEIPSHIFPPLIEMASQNARAAQYPRNFWLNTIAAAVSYACGQAVRVRASVNHETTGLQMFSFGVGGSGSGKSKTLKALLGPLSHSDAVSTEGSPEGLVSLMTRFRRGILLQFSEGKEFFKMLGRYGQNPGAGSDNSLFHKCWSGDKIRRSLQKGTFGLEDPFMTVIAGIQKINLNAMPLNDCIDGLLQRMSVFPLGDVPTKEDPVAMAATKDFLIEWYQIVDRLSTVKSSIGSPSLSSLIAGAGVPVMPLTLTLDPEAFKVWQDYAAMKRSDITMSQFPDEHPYRADLVRHAEMVLRKAGNLFMQACSCDKDFWEQTGVGNRDEGFIPKYVLENAIDWMEWDWQQKQILTDHLVEAAFASVSGTHMLQREESVARKVSQYVLDRRRRIESRIGEEWSLRQYYDCFRLKKMDAQTEIDMFLREGHIVQLPMSEGQKALRYKFLGEME
jgi:energy-coupling factor transporter ATP-binding protein EcfA2